MVISRAIASAMAQQVDRVNDSPDSLKQRNRELEALVETLRTRIERQCQTIRDLQTVAHGEGIEVHEATGARLNGRPVGNQSDFARKHGVKAYQVCRWCANHELQYIRRAGKYIVYLDQPCPAAKQPGRKKGSS